MASVIKKVLDLLPKLMNKDHFRQAEELLDHADAYNKTLEKWDKAKFSESKTIIEALLKIVSQLLEKAEEGGKKDPT